MKKLILLIAVTCFSLNSMAQSDPVGALFDKYAEREGFTVVTISGKMFSMFSDKENGNKDAGNVINKLNSIRILTVGDSLLNRNLNFYNDLAGKLELSAYEELMVVKEGKDITKFLIREKGDVISELLVISGGPGGNSVISIKGAFNLKNISDLSKEIGIEELKDLEGVDKK